MFSLSMCYKCSSNEATIFMEQFPGNNGGPEEVSRNEAKDKSTLPRTPDGEIDWDQVNRDTLDQNWPESSGKHFETAARGNSTESDEAGEGQREEHDNPPPSPDHPHSQS
jgi:hypothetical protein